MPFFRRVSAPVAVLVTLIAAVSSVAALFGILSDWGPGPFTHESLLWQEVEIYGKGVYRHMSSDVAIQGIAQDYVTLFLGVPLLVSGLFLFLKGGPKGRVLLSWVLLYFLLTYLFYTAMAAYDVMFLLHVLLLWLSFFAFLLSFVSTVSEDAFPKFRSEKVPRYAGAFIVAGSSMIGSLWLGVVVPPLVDGSIYPKELQHYTTLVVQGFDLWLFLPIGFVSGFLALRKNPFWYVASSVYVVFLSVLMVALIAKILFMANAGTNVFPVIFLMPAIWAVSFGLSVLSLRNLR